jgi:5-methylcytosine-specific restriction endonuclease McrA
LRLFILARDKGLCQCSECSKRFLPLPANEVNHKVPKAQAECMGWTQEQIDDPSNLEAVNHDCHERITMEQKGFKPRKRIGADGWPVA